MGEEGKKKGLRDEEYDDDDEEEPPIKKKKGKPTLILYTNITEFHYFRRRELKRWGTWKRERERKRERSWLVQP